VWRKACLLSLLAAVLVLLMSRQASATGSLSGVLETASQNHLFWYLSRTSAFLAYILLFINIVFGLGLKTKFLDKLSARWQSFVLHQFSALLAMAMITLHILSSNLDGFGYPQFLCFNYYRAKQLFKALHRPENLANDSYAFLRLVLCHPLSRTAQRQRHPDLVGAANVCVYWLGRRVPLPVAFSVGRSCRK
jgi:predicted ferric reductase